MSLLMLLMLINAGSVAETPSFFINGVAVRDAQSTWTEQQWHQLIDSLLTDTAYQVADLDTLKELCRPRSLRPVSK